MVFYTTKNCINKSGIFFHNLLLHSASWPYIMWW